MRVDRGWYEDEAERSATWPAEGSSWPSLGWIVAAWIEAHLAYGPGAKSGQPVKLTWEQVVFLVWAYRIDEYTGHRCFDRVVLSRGKGWAKSEFAAWITDAEALGPVRFSHWDDDGRPVGKSIPTPWIRLMATEETQVGNTFDAVRDSLLDGPAAEIFGLEDRRDVQQDRVVIPTGGVVQATTASARAKDGGRETFGVCDEVHLFVLAMLIQMIETVARNMAKRIDAEPWMLFTTTAYALGENSYAERLWERATKVANAMGRHSAPVADLKGRFLFDHREGAALTAEQIENDRDLVLAELRKAYGDATWMISDRVVAEMREGTVADANRYFLNAVVPGNEAYLDLKPIDDLASDDEIKPGDVICLGFDGSRGDDGTALVAIRVSDGLMQLLDYWQRPADDPNWQMPNLEVENAIYEAFARYRIIRAYFDPPYWWNEIDRVRERFPSQAHEWHTKNRTPMHQCLERFRLGLEDGRIRLSTKNVARAQIMRQQLGNAVRTPVPAGYNIAKPKQTLKIDCVMGGALASEALGDAIAAGETAPAEYTVGSWN